MANLESWRLGRLARIKPWRSVVKGMFDTSWIPYRLIPGLESWRLGSLAGLESRRSSVKGVFDTGWNPYRFNPGGLGA